MGLKWVNLHRSVLRTPSLLWELFAIKYDDSELYGSKS